MAIATAKVHVWNRALAFLGEERIVDPDDNNRKSTYLCNLVWVDILKAALEEYRWSFARKQTTLTQLGSVTREGWDYCYSLPDDCVTPLALLEDGIRIGIMTEDDKVVFETMIGDDDDARILVSDYDDDDFDALEYIFLNEYVPSWPSYFKEAVAWKLASELALGLKKDAQLAGSCLKMYDAMLARAKNSDAKFQQPDPELDTPSIAAR